MASSIDYEYENEDSIDDNLKCGICNDPFRNPVTTICHHSFCGQCLDSWLRLSNLTCPTCRRTISRYNSNKVTLLSFLSMLDQLLVECKLCKQSRIQRGNFEDHIEKVCPKVIVMCPASDLDCPWTGVRNELQTHLSTCTFEASRRQSDASDRGDAQKIGKSVKRRTPGVNLILQVANVYMNIITMHVNPQIEPVSERDLVTAVREAIGNKQCTHLNLFQHKLSTNSILQIASALSNGALLRSLELGMCSIGDTGVEFLTKNLPEDSCLEYLDLYENSITNAGVQYLAEMLKKNTRLSRLKLSRNRISNEGVQALTDVIVNHSSKLERLSLMGNTQITDACFYSILNLIRYTRTLKVLNLEGCSFSYYAQSLIVFCQKLYFRTDLNIVF